MAYLRWSNSAWHAYRLVGTPEGEDAIFVAYGHVSLRFRAGELIAGGCRGDVQALRRMAEGIVGCTEMLLRHSDGDWDELSEAADDFLREVYEGGLIAVPAGVARRHRILMRWKERAWPRAIRAWHEVSPTATSDSSEGLRERALVARLLVVEEELARNRRRYPGPKLPADVVKLLELRSVRVVSGKRISNAQEEHECQRIARAFLPIQNWPIR